MYYVLSNQRIAMLLCEVSKGLYHSNCKGTAVHPHVMFSDAYCKVQGICIINFLFLIEVSCENELT